MPTQKSIPERYPVIEHMEERLRAEGRATVVRQPAPGARVRVPASAAFVLGGVVGGAVFGVFVAWLQAQP